MCYKRRVEHILWFLTIDRRMHRKRLLHSMQNPSHFFKLSGPKKRRKIKEKSENEKYRKIEKI